jgi:dolichyl-phosphate-mannose--protein O-mannosyl transferase
MTPEFQETLADNVMTQQAVGIDYFDNIAMRHKETKVYLHSHPDRYPLRYDDGRISSQGQQVTGYPHNDTNNLWQIFPSVAMEGLGHPVKNGDLVRFRHLVTDTWLLTHDVASPFYPTNQEFSTVPEEEANGARFNDTLFELQIMSGKPDQQFKTMSSHFKLVHFPTRVAMWTHTTPLPDWAYKQAEINGNKNIQQSSNVWYVEEVPGIPADSPRLVKEEKKVKSLPFLQKYLELQRAMFFHNNALTSSHPYASQPIQWPFLLRGVSFWTENDTKQQIYFLGNPVGWWLASSILAVFAGILGADQLSLRRGIDALDQRKFNASTITGKSLTFKRHSLPSLRQHRLLLPPLGSPLHPLLHNGPPTLPPPLPPRAPCLRARGRCSRRIRLQYRASRPLHPLHQRRQDWLQRAAAKTPSTYSRAHCGSELLGHVGGDGCYFGGGDLGLLVLCSADVWKAWVGC